MARISVLSRVKKVTFTIETPLHRQAVKRAKAYGFQGGFSEYVSRLLIADLLSKTGLDTNTPRSFRPDKPTP